MKHLIIGAGPAGLQMASFLEDHLILEKTSTTCSFFQKFPRQRGLISINKSKDYRFDWNSFLGDSKSFRDYSEELYPRADDYLKYAQDFVERKNLNIRFNYEVKTIEKLPDGTFSVNEGEYIAEKVFFGIGLVPRESTMKIHPSITQFTYANMPLDKEVFRDKTVLIMGLGNAALETIDWLQPITKFIASAGRNINAWTSHYPGHARSKNFTSIDSFFLKAGYFIIYSSEPDAEKFTDTLEYRLLSDLLENNTSDVIPSIDIVIFCIGFKFDSSLVRNLVEICPKSGFPLLNDNFESTKTPGLFFIGANSQAKDYKKGTSAFIHGFRYNCEYIARNLKGIESQVLTRDEMIKTVFRQLNVSSCLFHRFDYFCDHIELLPNGCWKYTKEIPICAPPDKGFTMKLGYTNKPLDSFLQPTYIFPRDAHLCIFIHPIFNTKQVQFEIPEDLINEFSDKNWHILPFMYFIDFVEGSKTTNEVRDLIQQIPEKRGGRDLFFMDTS